MSKNLGRLAIGFQGRSACVAFLATPGNLDVYVANDAVGHFRQGGGADAVGLLEAAMADLAGVFRTG